MSGITVEQIQNSSESINKQLEGVQLIDWDQVQKNQTDLMVGFQGAMEKFVQFRDLMQRQFLVSLKEMKQLDAKDLLKQVNDKKSESSVLKGLVDYSTENDGKIEIDVDSLKEDTQEKQKKFQQLTSNGAQKLQETSKWIEDFLKQNFPDQVNQQQQQKENSGASNTQVSTQKQPEAPMNFKFDEDKLTQIASNIKVERIPGTDSLISIQTYNLIVEKSMDVAESEFIRLTLENRKQRRETLDKPKEYLQLMMDHLTDIENMLMKSQEVLCQKLGITQEKLEQSEVLLMERGLGQQLFILQASVRQKIKERLPKKSSVGASITKEIIEYQIKALNEKQDKFLPVMKEMPNNQDTQQIIPVLLNLMISDIIYDEYNYEEEDYMHNLTDQTYFKEQEIMKMLGGIEQGIVKLLQTSGLMPQQPPMGGMGGMGGMPGMGGMGGMPGMGF